MGLLDHATFKDINIILTSTNKVETITGTNTE